MTPMNKVYISGEGQHVWNQWTMCTVEGKVSMYYTNEQSVQWSEIVNMYDTNEQGVQ